MVLPISPALVSTTDSLPGYTITRVIGVAEGLGFAIRTGILPAGQLQALHEVMADAFLDMMTRAAEQGAHAVVGVRHVFPGVQQERIVVAYGTAVQVEKVSM